MAFPDDVLVEGERVVVHTRPHWRVLVGPVLAFLLVVGAAGAVPQHQQKGRVVLQVAGLVLEQGVHSAAHGLGRGQLGGEVAHHQVDESLLAVELPIGRPGLDHAVGVEQQHVAGLQLLGPHDGR